MLEKLSQIHRHELVLFFSVGALLSAYIAEYFGGIKPCYLCTLQRYVYWGMLSLSVFSLTYEQEQICDYGILAFLFMGIGLSFYHIGAEQEWWDSFCSIPWGNINSAEALERSIMGASSPNCNEINWRLVGVSATFWNLGLQVFLLGISYGLKKKQSTL